MAKLYNKFWLNECNLYMGFRDKIVFSIGIRNFDNLFRGFHKDPFFDRDILYEIRSIINKNE